MSDIKQPYLYGEPESTGELRSQMSDFKVFERLPFEPSGEGEHLYIRIRKTGCNTVFVARELAKYFDIHEKLVSYAGLKDRFAVTEQWFGVHVPGKQQYTLSDLKIDGVEVLTFARHNKKLKTGALTGNYFEITLRNVSDVMAVTRRWHMVCAHGVPNYFGEQRFGIEGGNIDKALAMFAGKKIRDKKKKSIYLSAARSLLFNHIISQRLTTGMFEQPIQGDILMLSGSQSIFTPDVIDEEIINRFNQKDVDITAPLWGKGEPKSGGDIYQIENDLLSLYPEICHGLVKFGLKQERRRIRLCISEPKVEYQEQEKLVKLGFFLDAGSFATTVLRELINYSDLTQRELVARN